MLVSDIDTGSTVVIWELPISLFCLCLPVSFWQAILGMMSNRLKSIVMKRNVMNFFLLSSLSIMFACSSDSDLDNFASVPIETKSQPIEIIDVDCQIEAIEAFNNMLKTFNSSVLKSGTQMIYPEYYGGSYINSDDKLVILTKKNANFSRDAISFTNNNVIVTEECDYSYNELLQLSANIFAEKASNINKNITDNYNRVSVCEDINRVAVYLLEYSEERMNEFKNTISNSPAIIFRQGQEEVEQSKTLNPGQYICSPTDDISIGYRAKRNNIPGFVTAAHGIASNSNDILDIIPEKIGTCTYKWRGGSVDAAFIETIAGVSISNILNGSNEVLSTDILMPPVGAIINMRGGETPHSWGKVTDINDEVSYTSGYSYTNLISAEYSSKEGDSGGIVYLYNSSQNKRYIVGIHQGSGTEAHLCKAGLVNEKLSLTLY